MPVEDSTIKVFAQLLRMSRAVLARDRRVEVRLRGDIDAVIYDRPGLWMDDDALASLREDVRSVARASSSIQRPGRS